MAMSAGIKAEIERKAAAGIPLAGDSKGNVSAENLAYYQALVTAKAASTAQNQSNQYTGGGVGSSGPVAWETDLITGATRPVYGTTGGGGGGSYPGNSIVPDNVSAAVKGYGFTAIVGLGVALVVLSIASSFRRVRGR